MLSWDTAGNIVNDAAVEIGLAAVADPFATAATDPNFARLCKLLKSVGRRIMRKKPWTALVSEYLLNTVQGQQTYPLPPDFDNMMDQSGWNRTTRLPIGGPLSPQEWQFIEARLVGVTWTILFRPQQGSFQAFPPEGATPGAMQIAFEYASNYWVQVGALAGAGQWAPGAAFAKGAVIQVGANQYLCVQSGQTQTLANGGAAPTSFGATLDGSVIWKYIWGPTSAPVGPNASAPVNSSDVVLLDSAMMVAQLKAKALADMGFDTGDENNPLSAAGEAKVALDAALNADTPAAVLNIAKARRQDPLLTTANLPLTGYGEG